MAKLLVQLPAHCSDLKLIKPNCRRPYSGSDSKHFIPRCNSVLKRQPTPTQNHTIPEAPSTCPHAVLCREGSTRGMCCGGVGGSACPSFFPSPSVCLLQPSRPQRLVPLEILPVSHKKEQVNI